MLLNLSMSFIFIFQILHEDMEKVREESKMFNLSSIHVIVHVFPSKWQNKLKRMKLGFKEWNR